MSEDRKGRSFEFALNDLTRRMRRVYNRQMLTAGISAQQAAALIFLDQFGPQSQLDLGDRMELHKAAIAALVARMEDAGLVTRAPDAEDRRLRIVSITPQAKTLLDRINGVTAEFGSAMRKGISDSERRQAAAVLVRMNENLRLLEESSKR